MKRIIPVILCLAALLAGFIVGKCTQESPQEAVLEKYTEVIQGQMPEDVRLTIYIMTFDAFYSVTVSREELMAHPHEKIIVGPEELAPYWETFRKIKPSALQLASEKEDFRQHEYGYVLEVGDGQGNYEKILEVSWDKPGENVMVNGVEVENVELLCDLVAPFMTYDERGSLYLF